MHHCLVTIRICRFSTTEMLGDLTLRGKWRPSFTDVYYMRSSPSITNVRDLTSKDQQVCRLQNQRPLPQIDAGVLWGVAKGSDKNHDNNECASMTLWLDCYVTWACVQLNLNQRRGKFSHFGRDEGVMPFGKWSGSRPPISRPRGCKG